MLMALKIFLFKGLFPDYDCIREFSIKPDKIVITFERFGERFSVEYDTEKLFVGRDTKHGKPTELLSTI